MIFATQILAAFQCWMEDFIEHTHTDILMIPIGFGCSRGMTNFNVIVITRRDGQHLNETSKPRMYWLEEGEAWMSLNELTCEFDLFHVGNGWLFKQFDSQEQQVMTAPQSNYVVEFKI
jgi:hypothetical protein